MKILVQLISIALIGLGLFAMFSSSMVGAGLSGFIGVPLFVVGLGLGVWQITRQRNSSA